MGGSAGPILMIGAVTIANRSILHSAPIDWKVPLSTGLLALGAAGLEHLNAPLVAGVAWIALLATLITPTGGYDAPLVSVAKLAGVNTQQMGVKPQPNAPKGGILV